MFNISQQTLIPQDLEESFVESLTHEEAENVYGGSLVVLDEDGRIIGWTITIVRIPGQDEPEVLSPVPPGTKPGDFYPYPLPSFKLR